MDRGTAVGQGVAQTLCKVPARPSVLTAFCAPLPHSPGVLAAAGALTAPSGVAERRNSSGVLLAVGVAPPAAGSSGEAGPCSSQRPCGRAKEKSADGELGRGASSPAEAVPAAAGCGTDAADALAVSAAQVTERQKIRI